MDTFYKFICLGITILCMAYITSKILEESEYSSQQLLDRCDNKCFPHQTWSCDFIRNKNISKIYVTCVNDLEKIYKIELEKSK